MERLNRDRQKTRLPGDHDYFEGNMYDDDLIFNCDDYDQNDILDGMEIRNITLMKGDMVKTNTQTEQGDEAMFIGVLPNNTVYLSWSMYFRKKLFVEEQNILCVKKVDKQKKIYEIWERPNGTEDFALTAQALL